jgi:hypothetical protein
MALTLHVLKDPQAGFKQKRYMERHLFIGNHLTGGGVRAFLDLIDVLSTYLPLFPPILNVTYQELTNKEKQLMLFYALSKDYNDQMKKANQVSLEMPLEELRSYALNIEETKVNKVKNSILTETKDNSNNNNPIFSFCGKIGHVENTCRSKERAMKEAKKSTKDKAQKWKKDKLEKAQSFATATAKAVSASAFKNNDSDDDKFDKYDFINAFIKYYDKSQNQSSGKGKRKRIDSDNDSSDSDSNYSKT